MISCHFGQLSSHFKHDSIGGRLEFPKIDRVVRQPLTSSRNYASRLEPNIDRR